MLLIIGMFQVVWVCVGSLVRVFLPPPMCCLPVWLGWCAFVLPGMFACWGVCWRACWPLYHCSFAVTAFVSLLYGAFGGGLVLAGRQMLNLCLIGYPK